MKNDNETTPSNQGRIRTAIAEGGRGGGGMGNRNTTTTMVRRTFRSRMAAQTITITRTTITTIREVLQ